MWDEFVLGGEVQETSKKNVLKAISDQDMIQEVFDTLTKVFSYYCFFFFCFNLQEETPQGFFDDQGLG